jgi:hypothetical protein
MVGDIVKHKEKMKNEQDTKYGNSKDTIKGSTNKNKESLKNNELLHTEATQKINKMIDNITINYNKQMGNPDIRQVVSDMSIPKSVLKGNNIERFNDKQQQTKTVNRTNIMSKIIETHNKEKLKINNDKVSRGTTKNNFIPRSYITKEKYQVNMNGIQRNNVDSINTSIYTTKIPDDVIDRVKQNVGGFDYSVLNTENKESNNNNTLSINSMDIHNVQKNTEMDNDLVDNKTFDRYGGIMGNKYLARHLISDHDVNPIHELTSM